MKKFLIVVEGKADASFIKDYLKYHLKIEFEIKEVPNQIIMEFSNIHIKFLILKGYTVIATDKITKRLKEESDQLYKLILIQDADDPTKENGGVKARMKYLNQIKTKEKLDFETFLFPNHMDDGDLETLLLKIVKIEKFKKYIENYVSYAEYVKTISIEIHGLELLQDKFKIFNYFQVYHGMDKAKEENREFNIDYWEMSNHHLTPLYNFFDSILKFHELEKIIV